MAGYGGAAGPGVERQQKVAEQEVVDCERSAVNGGGDGFLIRGGGSPSASDKDTAGYNAAGLGHVCHARVACSCNTPVDDSQPASVRT
jgi:hypothetical protein